MTAIKNRVAKKLARNRRALKSAARSIAIGMGSCLALNGHYYRPPRTAGQAEYSQRRSDAEALRSDWEKVGNDIQTALDTFRATQS